jgi:predicted phosphohydrolase
LRCHVPRVSDHESAVVHHLTYAPYNEPKEETVPFNSIPNQGTGTEDNPFTVYRDSQLIGKENLKHLRFVCMSDTHNEIEKIHIPNGDVFIHCGDAVKHRTSSRDIVRFNQFVGSLPHKYKLFISGNHCVCLDPTRPDLSQQLLSNMTYLQDQLIDIEGIRIYGSPWRPKRGLLYQAEAFGYDPKLIREDKWSNIPEDLDFLLTHGPPYSIRDYHPLTDERIGCPGLLTEVVTRVRPRVHLFGHMHTCHGASLYKNEDNRILIGDTFNPESHDILFINLAVHQGRTLGEAVVIDYYY